MSRRSSRLKSGGYYNSDEESDSSSVTNISYRENPVKVFKKKAVTRKAATPTSSRASSNASSATPERPVTPGLDLFPSSVQPQPVMRTVPYAPTAATPRPALTGSSPQSQTPTKRSSVTPEKNTKAGLSISEKTGVYHRPHLKGPSQSGADSSGYSSSEGTYLRPLSATNSSSSSTDSSKVQTPNAGYIDQVRSAFWTLIDSAVLMTAEVQSKIPNVRALANASMSRRTKQACALALLLLILLLCIWLLLPLFTSLLPHLTVTQMPTLTPTKKTENQPSIFATPPPQPSVTPTPVMDPAVVSAAVEAKMKHSLVELQIKQEQLLSQLKEKHQLDMQVIKAKLEAADSSLRLHVEQEVARLLKQIEGSQAESHSAATSLSLKIQTLEALNAKLSQELLSIQSTPTPCPNSSPAPNQNFLTPELQQAMEKWLTDRIKEQDVIRFGDRGGCPECRQPLADKMADFALETQGASVISTRCSETYRIRSACLTLFGFPLWYPSESPRTVIQGFPVLLPGKCWAFHGVQGTLVISLSHPIRISHVTLDHLPRYNAPTGRIDSAPKDFQVYGMKNDTEEGMLIGAFTYDENGESSQTFELPNPSDVVYRVVELRVLSNWGHMEYTCLYRFRVHGKIATS
uniref:SUN domain-containing protein n=1 Tax=Oryzias latipes TaxID=8090 RepID=A0A3P9LZH8_ORYLA